jgi:AcrR family transcriptional regulator
MIETRDRILDAAERLFAERGYAATSLRSIMAEAGVNVAAIHYHFHSKESLLEAILLRRLDPANRERLSALEDYEASVVDGRLEVDRILEAFLYPTFRMAADPASGGYTFIALLGRLQAESDLLPNIVFSRLGPVLLRFAGALGRALPDLPPSELFLRARLAMGAAAQVLRDAPHIHSLTQNGAGNGSLPHWESLMERIIPFLSAGFRVPHHGGAELGFLPEITQFQPAALPLQENR